jgi:hypothetical protein
MVVYRTYPIVQQAILLDGIVLNDHERLQVCNFDVFSVFSFGLGRSKVTIIANFKQKQNKGESFREKIFIYGNNPLIFTAKPPKWTGKHLDLPGYIS